MTFYAFRLLSPVVQLYWVLKYGTYLTQNFKYYLKIPRYNLAF